VELRLTRSALDETTHLVAVAGEADLYTAPELKQEIIDASTDGATVIVVDLTEATFIDSTALGVLVSGLKRLRPEGGDLPLIVADSPIRRIFEITSLDRAFSIYETQAEALAALGIENPAT
jgi:anti-sigma B factor antagonist